MNNLTTMKYCLGLAFISYPLSALALSCTTPPSCDTLGYKQSASDCTNRHALKCPFDSSKLFCGDCTEDFKLTSCDIKKGQYISCGDKCKYTSCNYGWILENDNCVENPCPNFQENSNANGCKGIVARCFSGTVTKYKCSECDSCYDLINGQCKGKDGFQKMTIIPVDVDYTTCTFKGETYYKITSCPMGKELCISPTYSLCTASLKCIVSSNPNLFDLVE